MLSGQCFYNTVGPEFDKAYGASFFPIFNHAWFVFLGWSQFLYLVVIMSDFSTRSPTFKSEPKIDS